MSASIPMVRASVATPLEMWLHEHGHQAEQWFLSADLPRSPSAVKMRLVPLHNFVNLLSKVADSEGPDLPCRVAALEGPRQIGVPWLAIRSSQTVREALVGVSRVMHMQVSHFNFIVDAFPGGVRVSVTLPIKICASAQHAVQQYIAMLVSQFGVLGWGDPLPMQIEMMPHPKYGLDHLVSWFGRNLRPADSRRLTMTIRDEILNERFAWRPVQAPELARPGQLDRVGSDSLAGSAALLLESMLDQGEPTIEWLARASGRSRRTLQRMLAAEDTSFSQVLDAVRHDRALNMLNSSDTRISDIARDLGYRTPSSLTRAVRRWTEDSPRTVRNMGTR